MHLVRGMTSLNTKKRKVKRKPGWEKAQAEHDAWLRKMNAHPDQLKEIKREFKTYEFKESFSRTTESYPSLSTSDSFRGSTAKTEPKQYTGDQIVGIATLHKSNMVPVSRGDNPEIYAKMRR